MNSQNVKTKHSRRVNVSGKTVLKGSIVTMLLGAAVAGGSVIVLEPPTHPTEVVTTDLVTHQKTVAYSRTEQATSGPELAGMGVGFGIMVLAAVAGNKAANRLQHERYEAAGRAIRKPGSQELND